MNNVKQYPGYYRDKIGTLQIVVENDFKTLFCKIDGIDFRGRELSDLSICDRHKYTNAQLERFDFYPIKVYGTNDVELLLCNCSFHLSVPQTIIDIEKSIEFSVDIKIDCFLSRHTLAHRTHTSSSEVYELCLTINEQTYSGRSEHIEDVLLEIQHEFGERYRFKNCFGCMYGDYSVYGSCAFGSMICFSNQKEKHKQVTNKDEYMDLDLSDCARVQEIYCCEDFERRKIGTGYRG